jgi:hypothetical protein
VARLYLSPEERTDIASAMDRTRTGEPRYRRALVEVVAAHPHAAQSLMFAVNPASPGPENHPKGWHALESG